MHIFDDQDMMSMITLIINPFEIDVPMLSYDCINMMGTSILYLESFDTIIEHTFAAFLIKQPNHAMQSYKNRKLQAYGKEKTQDFFKKVLFGV